MSEPTAHQVLIQASAHMERAIAEVGAPILDPIYEKLQENCFRERKINAMFISYVSRMQMLGIRKHLPWRRYELFKARWNHTKEMDGLKKADKAAYKALDRAQKELVQEPLRSEIAKRAERHIVEDALSLSREQMRELFSHKNIARIVENHIESETLAKRYGEKEPPAIKMAREELTRRAMEEESKREQMRKRERDRGRDR